MSRVWVMLVLLSVGGLWLTGCESDSPEENPNPTACVEDNCGVCDDDPTNDCTKDCAGEWGGTAVVDCEGTCGGGAECCEAGHFGPDCEECPGGAATPCGEHGTCDEGSDGEGACKCEAGWGGPACDVEGARSINQVTSEQNGFNSLYPQVSTGGGATYLVWQACKSGDDCEKLTVMASRYHDGWGTAVEVSPLSIGSANGTKPDVVVDSTGVAHIIWSDSGTVGQAKRPIDSNIIYRTWDGTTLGDISVVSVGGPLECTAGNCYLVAEAAIALAGDSPRVVFSGGGADPGRDFEVYYAKPEGASWSVEKLSDSSLDPVDTPMSGGKAPAIASDLQGNVHVLWRNEQADYSASIHYVSIGVGDSIGTITDTAIPTCSEGGGRVIYPNIALGASGEVHAVWLGSRDCGDFSAGFGVFYSAKGATAVDLTADASLSAASNSSPVVVATPLGVAVTWVSDADVSSSGSDHDVVSQWFGADGAPVPGLQVLSEELPEVGTSARSGSPSVAVGAVGLHTCWQEIEDGDAGDYDIYCTVDVLAQ